MSTHKRRDRRAAPARRGGVTTSSSRVELARLLDSPHLARTVRALAPETLHQLIHHHGLDACGALVSSATPEQLTSVFDLDLWQGAVPGADERFDEARFGEWLEALIDMGDSEAARIVSSLDTSLVIAGLSRHVRVFDVGTFEPTEQSDDERPDAALKLTGGTDDGRVGGSAVCEVAGYVVRATRLDAWDAIIALLVALEDEHEDYFHAVMHGCRRVSNSAPEVDGLDDLFMAPEQMMHDLALDREQRRSQQGYISPADARAFLQMAREARHDENNMVNAIATAYFRDVGREGAGDRQSELAFLANVLMSGCSLRTRAFTPREASDVVIAACKLGIELEASSAPATGATQSTESAESTGLVVAEGDEFLFDRDLLASFQRGWAVLYREVSLSTADHLIAVLSDLRGVDDETLRGIDTLRRALVKQREAGTPWLASPLLDALSAIDMPAWTALLGLLDECPHIPVALTAIVERRIGAISATAFELISTRRQLDLVRAFITRLPDLLRP